MASQPASQITLSGAYGPFRNNKSLRTALVALLVADSMLALLVIITNLINQPGVLHQPDKHSVDILHWGGNIRFLVRVLAMLMFCIWVNRSCRNAWLLDPPKMKTTPAWAVGYYFIPVLSLWKPYTSMSEIRDASFGRHDKLTTLLPLWWICWIACLALALSHFTLSHFIHDTAVDEEALLMIHKLDTIAGAVSIVFNSLAIMLIVTITGTQHGRAAQWRS